MHPNRRASSEGEVTGYSWRCTIGRGDFIDSVVCRLTNRLNGTDAGRDVVSSAECGVLVVECCTGLRARSNFSGVLLPSHLLSIDT